MSVKKSHSIEGFYDRVDQICQKSGLTKSEIARRAGFERRTLNATDPHWMMSSANVARLCAVTGADANWLLGIKERNMDKYNIMFITKEDTMKLINRLSEAVVKNSDSNVVLVDVEDLKGGLLPEYLSMRNKL